MALASGPRPDGRARLASTVVLLLALSACPGEGTEVAGPTTSSGSSETTVQSTVPSTAASTSRPAGQSANSTPSTRPGSLLQRRDAPPEGIKAQFEFFQEGDGSCRGLDQRRPAALVEFPQPTIGMMFAICFPGFVPNQPLRAEVKLPDGTTRKMDVDSYDINEGVAQWFWYSLPGDPIGTHTVRATQQTMRGTGTFTVRRASTPRLLVPPPFLGPAGTTFQVGMAGFTPRSEVLFFLYRKGDGPYQYVTSFTVRFDGNGEATRTFATRSDDPKGGYCLVFHGPKAAPEYTCGQVFTIT